MKDEDKTKEQLIEELVALRQRNAQLEPSLTQQQLKQELNSERLFMATLLDVTDGLLQNFVRAVLENDNTLVVVCDRQGRIVNFNRTCVETTGYSLDEVKNKHIWELLLLPEEVETAKTAFGKVVAGQSISQYINHWLTKSGEQREIIWSLNPIVDSDNFVQNIIGTGIDITERTLAANALRQSEERFRSAFDYSAVGMALVDLDGCWLKVNRSLCEIVGYSEQELLNTTFQAITHPDDLETDLNYLRQLLDGKIRYYHMEKRYFHKQGHVVWILLSVSLVRSLSGEPLHFISQIQDITLRQQASEEIRKNLAKEKELNSLKSSFVAMASHEFRNPLSTIYSSAQLLEDFRDSFSESKQLFFLHQIQDTVKSMLEILNDILILGMSDEGKLDFNPQAIDLQEFCWTLIFKIQMVYRDRQIRFTPLGECPWACVDEKLLQHILTNLLDNAVKYSPAGGIVEFSLGCENGSATFIVKDSGIGIPLEEQAKLFESFHRASNVGNIKGTGLGLSIVKRMVDLHGGTIAVNSKVGVGTTFTVTIPYADAS